MERIENTGFGNLKLIQDTEQFCYGVDAVILADFACNLYPGFSEAVDLCTGNGIIPLILSHKNRDARICGIDIQNDAIELAERSCRLNCLDNRLSFVCGDIMQICTDSEKGNTGRGCEWEAGSYDMVTCNPPYFARGGAVPAENRHRFIARHETTASVEDFVKAAALLLGKHGHFFMVHRPHRLVDIFYYSRKHGLEPKDMRMVVPKPGEAPNIVLIHCIKGGGKELKVMKELAVYGEDGDYSEETEKIYERK